jgi:hypothetical protein
MTLEEISNKKYAEMRNLPNNTDVRIIEMNADSYFLGDHPAVRLVLIVTPPEGTEGNLYI